MLSARPALLAFFLLGACSDSTEPGSPGDLRIIPNQLTLESGTELQLAAVRITAGGDTLPAGDVLWSSSDPDIAWISSDGRVSGERSGVATIVGLTSSDRAIATVGVERRFKAIDLAVGQDHACALDPAGRAWCFGQDRGGSLGLGTFWQVTATMTSPVLNAPVFTAISVTWATSCGLSLAGQVWCWGYNPSNGLGHFPRGEDSAVPVLADTIRTYDFISGSSSSTCGLSASIIYCWGQSYGLPRAPLSDPALRFSHVSVGAFDDCGVTLDGSALCWYQQPFASASGPASPRFIRLSTAHDWDGYGQYVCGISLDGAIYCWGENTNGQLGDGTTQPHSDPARIGSPHHFTDIATHPRHACALTDLGTVYCWGANDFGQLGRGDSTAASIPQLVDTPVRFRDIETYAGSLSAIGVNRVCGITTEYDLFCWGEGFGPRPAPVLY